MGLSKRKKRMKKAGDDFGFDCGDYDYWTVSRRHVMRIRCLSWNDDFDYDDVGDDLDDVGITTHL